LGQLSIYSFYLSRIYSKLYDLIDETFCYYQFMEEDIRTLKCHVNRLKSLLDSFILQLNESKIYLLLYFKFFKFIF
jgi:hypothetical protein